MIGMLRDWYGARRAEMQLRGREARLQESLTQSYADYANRYVDVDRFVYGLGDQDTSPVGRRIVSLTRARNEARQFVIRDPHARNALNQIVNFTTGQGFAIKFADEQDVKRWEEDAARMRWPKRRREIMRRIVRDGEAFLRRFKDDIRFVEPHLVRTPPGESEGVSKGIIDGVAFEPDDVEDVKGYWVEGDEVPAEEMFHFRDPFRDLNEPRGWPLIYDSKPVIEQYTQWVQTRVILNQLRSAIIAIRKHKGMTPGQVQSFADRVKGGTLTRKSGQSQRWADKWLPGTVIDSTDDVELDFPGAKIKASDAAGDGRSMRLLIAVFFQFPEYWATADASNANFSSTLVAENPGIIAMRSWQSAFGDDIREFFNWWYGKVLEVKTVFPNLVTRDPLKDTQARAIRQEHEALSIETWIELDGLDPKAERERMAQRGEV